MIQPGNCASSIRYICLAPMRLLAAVLFVLIAACDSRSDPPDDGAGSISTGTGAVTGITSDIDDLLEYDSNSWRDIIVDSCSRFSDGCNTCIRSEGAEIAACTRRACAAYQRPVCLEEESEPALGSDGDYTSGARIARFQCNDNQFFTAYYGLYMVGDQRVSLNDDEVMFTDEQTLTTDLLTRVPSASGARYHSQSGIDYWNRGDEATVQNNSMPYFSNCQLLTG